jgi:hypothetical protein
MDGIVVLTDRRLLAVLAGPHVLSIALEAVSHIHLDERGSRLKTLAVQEGPHGHHLAIRAEDSPQFLAALRTAVALARISMHN